MYVAFHARAAPRRACPAPPPAPSPVRPAPPRPAPRLEQEIGRFLQRLRKRAVRPGHWRRGLDSDPATRTEGPCFRPLKDCRHDASLVDPPPPRGKEDKGWWVEPEVTPELRSTFKDFDRNGDGTLQYKELGAALTAMGVDPGDEMARLLLLRHDLNRNGVLELAEFAALVADIKKEQASRAASVALRATSRPGVPRGGGACAYSGPGTASTPSPGMRIGMQREGVARLGRYGNLVPELPPEAEHWGGRLNLEPPPPTSLGHPYPKLKISQAGSAQARRAAAAARLRPRPPPRLGGAR